MSSGGVKCCLAGDNGVGKSALGATFFSGELPRSRYLAWDNASVMVKVKVGEKQPRPKSVALYLVDTLFPGPHYTQIRKQR